MSAAASPGSLPDALRLGAVHLTVTNLERAIAFYTDPIGLRVLDDTDGVAALGTGEDPVLVLYESASARPGGRHAGLFHFALLFPSREELGHAGLRLAAARTPIQGASDHGTHEAIYLADPDGNGIELAADRPRDTWPSPREIYARGPEPLDLDDLLDAAGEEPSASAAPGLGIGHVHLHVGSVDDGLSFYRDVVGLDEMARIPKAAFVSAGGYHHHLAFNTWAGEGVPADPDDAVGLRHWSIVLPAGDGVDALRARAEAAGVPAEERDGALVLHDPWGIELRVDRG